MNTNKYENIDEQINKCISVMEGTFEDTFRKQISLFRWSPWPPKWPQLACHCVVLLMDDSITVPQHAVSPPALPPPPIQECSCAFSHVETAMIQMMTKQVHLSCKNPSF